MALALRPLGGRFPQTPAGFSDYAVEVPSQGDRFAPYAPVDPAGPALSVSVDGIDLNGTQVVERARADAEALGLKSGSRLLSGLGYGDWAGLSAGLYAPLAVGGSVVLCRHLDQLPPDGLTQRIDSERITDTAV